MNTTWNTYEDIIHHPPEFREYATLQEAKDDTAHACLIDVVKPIDQATMADAYYLIERWDLRVAKIIIPEGHHRLRHIGLENENSIWGAKVIECHMVQPGDVWILPEDEFLQHGHITRIRTADQSK